MWIESQLLPYELEVPLPGCAILFLSVKSGQKLLLKVISGSCDINHHFFKATLQRGWGEGCIYFIYLFGNDRD